MPTTQDNICKALNGYRGVYMLGATLDFSDPQALTYSIKARNILKAKSFKVWLENDMYKVEFYNSKGKVLKTESSIFGNQLKRVVETSLELYLSL